MLAALAIHACLAWNSAAAQEPLFWSNLLAVPEEPAHGSLSMQAVLVYGPTDRQAVAGVQFFLMNRDVDDIQARSGLTQQQWLRQTDKIVTPFSYCSAAAMKLIRPHILEEVKTDGAGKASFRPVAPGTYYLTGYVEMRGGFAIWNLKVNVKRGANSVMLDQKNAGYFK